MAAILLAGRPAVAGRAGSGDPRPTVSVLWADTRADIAGLRAFLGSMQPDQWELRGLHPTLGAITVDELVEMFLVGHLEQHADQLEGMSKASV